MGAGWEYKVHVPGGTCDAEKVNAFGLCHLVDRKEPPTFFSSLYHMVYE